MKNRYFGSLMLVMMAMVAFSATTFASVWGGPPVAVPEADPTLLIAVGVAAVGYVAAVAKHRRQR